MRYITQFSNLILQTKNGALVARFGTQGVLIVGDPTTRDGAGNRIDSVLKGSTPNDETMRVFPTDLLGNSIICDEMVGMGSLISLDTADSPANLTSLQVGYNRNYFEAAIQTSSDVDTGDASTVSDVYYEVLTGEAIYQTVTYTKGQIFITINGIDDAVTGTGTFALTIPPALNIECQAFRPEHFKIKTLLTGNESTTPWTYSSDYTPRDDMVTSDPDYFGYVE